MIKEISKIRNLERIRYTTSHPIDFTEDLIDIHGYNSKLMPLIHLPVQSGSNRILKSMNRKHTEQHKIYKIYRILLELLKMKRHYCQNFLSHLICQIYQPHQN